MKQILMALIVVCINTDSVHVLLDSIYRLNDWLLIERNTVYMYGKMTRRLIFENDSLRNIKNKKR